VDGDVEINISGGTFASNIFLAGNKSNVTGDCTMTIGAVGIGGNVFAGTADTGYVGGDLSITVDGTTIGGMLSGGGYGTFTQAEGKTSTLTVGAAGVTAGAVQGFDSITMDGGATIAATTLTASAITADMTGYGSGSYTLATGFAAQDSVITVTEGSSTLGAVTLSDTVTSGSFFANNKDYTVSAADGALKLVVVSHDYFVVATGGTTFFGDVQEAIAFAHTQENAVLYVNTAADVNSYFEGVETHFIVGPTTAKMRYGAVDARVSTLQPATTKLVVEAGVYDTLFGGGYNPVSGAVNPDYTAESFEIVMNGGTTANLYAGGRTSGTKF
jgi:hypothetical protein